MIPLINRVCVYPYDKNHEIIDNIFQILNLKNMKKIIFFLIVICLFTAFTTIKAQAVVTNTHTVIIQDHSSLINPCNGENISFTGTLEEDLHVVINGNKFITSKHQAGHFVGTGDQGNTYVANIQANVPLNGSLTNGQFTFTETINVPVISKGGAPNFVMHVLNHLTINAKGDVTSFTEEISSDCRGL